ncbi:hypothetical protein Mapa_001440 [Marchantia paleacea]|nr:hypothetical protein Mapa_001440 [Marchantia paleacea]
MWDLCSKIVGLAGSTELVIPEKHPMMVLRTLCSLQLVVNFLPPYTGPQHWLPLRDTGARVWILSCKHSIQKIDMDLHLVAESLLQALGFADFGYALIRDTLWR